VSEPRARFINLHCSSCRGEEKFVWCILAVNFDLLNSIEIITVIAGVGIRFDLNFFWGGVWVYSYHIWYILKDYIPVLQFLKDFVEVFWELRIEHAHLFLTVRQCLLQCEFQISFYALNYLCLIFRLRNSRKFVDSSCLNDGYTVGWVRDVTEFQTRMMCLTMAGHASLVIHQLASFILMSFWTWQSLFSICHFKYGTCRRCSNTHFFH